MVVKLLSQVAKSKLRSRGYKQAAGGKWINPKTGKAVDGARAAARMSTGATGSKAAKGAAGLKRRTAKAASKAGKGPSKAKAKPKKSSLDELTQKDLRTLKRTKLSDRPTSARIERLGDDLDEILQGLPRRGKESSALRAKIESLFGDFDSMLFYRNRLSVVGNRRGGVEKRDVEKALASAVARFKSGLSKL